MDSYTFLRYFLKLRILLQHHYQKHIIGFNKIKFAFLQNGKYQTLQKMSSCLLKFQNQPLFVMGLSQFLEFKQIDLRRLIQRLLMLFEVMGQPQIKNMTKIKSFKNNLQFFFLSQQKIKFQQIIILLNNLFSQLKQHFSQDIQLCRSIYQENQKSKNNIESQARGQIVKIDKDLNKEYRKSLQFRKKISKNSLLVEINQLNQQKQSKKEICLPQINTNCSINASFQQNIQTQKRINEQSNDPINQKNRKKKVQKKQSLLLKKNVLQIKNSEKKIRSLSKFINNGSIRKITIVKKSQQYYERAQKQLLRRRKLIQNKYCRSQNSMLPVRSFSIEKHQSEIIHKKPQIFLFKQMVRELGYLNI